MFTLIRNMHPVTGIVIGVVATLVLSGTAMAITDTSFTYSTVQTGYLMIGPADLLPFNSNFANDYNLDQGASSMSVGCFVAPVHLPQGARMTSVRTSYASGVGSRTFLHFRRVNPVTGAGADLIPGQYVVFDDSNTRTYVNHMVPADLRLVNNALYTYAYLVCVERSDYFYGARITYQYYSAGD